MSFSNWIAFFIAAWLIALSPGSGAVLSMAHGLSYGVRRTSVTIFGLQAGLLLVLGIAGAGVGSLLVASERAFFVVKVVGALYLIYLGISQWRSADNPLLRPGDARAGVQVPHWRRRFWTGFLTNTTNPKGILFMVAVLPQFIDQHTALLPQLAILGATMCAVDLLVMHSYAALAASLQRFMSRPGRARLQNRFFGSVLMLIGAGLFFVKGRGAS